MPGETSRGFRDPERFAPWLHRLLVNACYEELRRQRRWSGRIRAQKPVTVGGLAATQLDIQTHDKTVAFGPIAGITAPGLGLAPNTLNRLFVVRVGGRQVVIGLYAEDGSLDELQPLVDSIVWH